MAAVMHRSYKPYSFFCRPARGAYGFPLQRHRRESQAGHPVRRLPQEVQGRQDLRLLRLKRQVERERRSGRPGGFCRSIDKIRASALIE